MHEHSPPGLINQSNADTTGTVTKVYAYELGYNWKGVIQFGEFNFQDDLSIQVEKVDCQNITLGEIFVLT
jgi:hypothetical protein